MRLGRAMAVVAGLMTAVGLAVPAGAQTSALCRQLLADYGRVQARSVAADPVGDALQRQQAALSRAQADYDRMCGVGLFSRPAAACPQIAAKIGEMQTNVQRMQSRARGTNVADPNVEQERARLAAEIRANGCSPGADTRSAGVVPRPAAPPSVNVPPGAKVFTLPGPDGPVHYMEKANGDIQRIMPSAPARIPASATPPGLRPVEAPPPGGGGLLGAIFGRPMTPPGIDDAPGGEAVPLLDEEGGGAYRTLCVRTCDGYYFPISYSTSPSRFATDSEICHARCPAAETRLFVHPVSEESEHAVAADDLATPYAKMSYALRYRSEYVKDCTCGRPDPSLLPLNASAEDGARSKYGTVKVGDLRPDIPFPDPKPRIDDDPDSRWNEIAGFTPIFGPIAMKAAEDPAGASAERKVRVVGPKFFVAR